MSAPGGGCGPPETALSKGAARDRGKRAARWQSTGSQDCRSCVCMAVLGVAGWQESGPLAVHRRLAGLPILSVHGRTLGVAGCKNEEWRMATSTSADDG